MTIHKTTAVIGGGTMGGDIAATIARTGSRTHIVEPADASRATLARRIDAALTILGAASRSDRVSVHASLDPVPWPEVDLVIEAIPENLALKRALFAELVRRARPDTWLASNSSAIPISEIGAGLAGRGRMFGLHYFMPAHSVPLVELVLGAESDRALAEELAAFMRATGKRPVLVKKDVPGFIGNRLQHALCREAYHLIDEGIASPEDIDAAVRFSFGFRYLAVGPILQRDHAGLDVHLAAAAKMYPDLADGKEPAKCLREHVAAGHLGIKSGRGFFEWTPETIAAEKARYDRLLRGALALIDSELPKAQG
jgi:3-hydroxybutyryl-CoA dehydrogenase